MRLRFGCGIGGPDGNVGKLTDVVVRPGEPLVTHIVVKPHRFRLPAGRARLVPFELVRAGSRRGRLRLTCTRDAFDRCFPVEEGAYIPFGDAIVGEEGWDVGVTDVVPSNLSGSGELGIDQGPTGYTLFRYDLIPKGEAELRSLSAVTTSDGRDLGVVAGLVTDEDGRVTQVLIARRRLWRRGETEIPVSAVRSIATDEVRTALTPDEVERLKRGERPPRTP